MGMRQRQMAQRFRYRREPIIFLYPMEPGTGQKEMWRLSLRKIWRLHSRMANGSGILSYWTRTKILMRESRINLHIKRSIRFQIPSVLPGFIWMRHPVHFWMMLQRVWGRFTQEQMAKINQKLPEPGTANILRWHFVCRREWVDGRSSWKHSILLQMRTGRILAMWWFSPMRWNCSAIRLWKIFLSRQEIRSWWRDFRIWPWHMSFARLLTEWLSVERPWKKGVRYWWIRMLPALWNCRRRKPMRFWYQYLMEKEIPLFIHCGSPEQMPPKWR